jgi:ubiquinone/menaquinone biosynthesis C-methylase UbiE
MATSTDQLIKKHYRKEAGKHGTSKLSTMEDEVTRNKEVEVILGFFELLKKKTSGRALRVLDLGCGNGYTLSRVAEAYSQHKYWGADFSEELLRIARNRKLPNCTFENGDARKLRFPDSSFDVVYTERCLINLLHWEEQQVALREIKRILKRNGYYLMIESFTDGLANNNRARREFGLKEIPQAYHNRYFDKGEFLKFSNKCFTSLPAEKLDRKRGSALIPSNFLSSHYFIARVLHPVLSQEALVRNSEFVKFFSFLPPSGNYSSIQAFILRKQP